MLPAVSPVSSYTGASHPRLVTKHSHPYRVPRTKVLQKNSDGEGEVSRTKEGKNLFTSQALLKQ